MNNLKCTIIIPTYNRQNLLRRLLNYYNNLHLPYHIIIGDSSSEINKKINKELISSLSNLSVNYMGEFSSKIHFYEKLFSLIKEVKSKYCVICADDDFIVPNAINKAIDFLENNSEYIAVGGRYIGFWVEKNKNDKKLFKWTYIYHYKGINKSISYPYPISRFIFHFASYTPTFYYVIRTKYIRFFYKDVMKLESEPVFLELFPSILTAIYGKIKYLNILYGARDAHHFIDKKWMFLRDYIKSGIYPNLYSSFREKLIHHLIGITKLNRGKIEKLIDDSMILYVKKTQFKSIQKSTKNLRFVLHFYKIYSKIFIIDLILLLFMTIFVKRYTYIKLLLRKKYNNSSSKSYKDFMNIKKIVLNYTEPYE